MQEIRTYITAGTLLALAFAPAAYASDACRGDPGEICSKAWDTDKVPCTGTDEVVAMSTPWEPYAIRIVGISISTFQVPTNGFQYVFAGNSYQPDVMLHMGAGETSARIMFPSGLGFEFARDRDSSESDVAHVDLHAACSQGDVFEIEYVLYYTRETLQGKQE